MLVMSAAARFLRRRAAITIGFKKVCQKLMAIFRGKRMKSGETSPGDRAKVNLKPAGPDMGEVFGGLRDRARVSANREKSNFV
jgi:hypothetical protein